MKTSMKTYREKTAAAAKITLATAVFGATIFTGSVFAQKLLTDKELANQGKYYVDTAAYGNFSRELASLSGGKQETPKESTVKIAILPKISCKISADTVQVQNSAQDTLANQKTEINEQAKVVDWNGIYDRMDACNTPIGFQEMETLINNLPKSPERTQALQYLNNAKNATGAQATEQQVQKTDTAQAPVRQDTAQAQNSAQDAPADQKTETKMPVNTVNANQIYNDILDAIDVAKTEAGFKKIKDAVDSAKAVLGAEAYNDVLGKYMTAVEAYFNSQKSQEEMPAPEAPKDSAQVAPRNSCIKPVDTDSIAIQPVDQLKGQDTLGTYVATQKAIADSLVKVLEMEVSQISDMIDKEDLDGARKGIEKIDADITDGRFKTLYLRPDVINLVTHVHRYYESVRSSEQKQ
ncbi:MAG: hypothetical protein NT051_02265 [Candidatus Micrarchaeota archaeon]|nr:hypothetical protein [Candidatus Micrarchaeota archaeon]